MKRYYDYSEWYTIVEPIITSEEFLKRKEFRHHGNNSVYDHSLKVSKYAYRFAKLFNFDYKSAAIAGVLHDFYENPWQEDTIRKPFFERHGFTHAENALMNSRKFYRKYLNGSIENAILRHMFPLNICPPKSIVGFIITIVDKCASIDFLMSMESLGKTFKLK